MIRSIHDKRILITGGTGFIGSNLTRRLLSTGAEIHLLIRRSTNLWRLRGLARQPVLHYCDLLDLKQIRKIFSEMKPQLLFHFATPSGHPDSPDQRVELISLCAIGTNHLLEASMEFSVEKFIHAGSSLEYGPKDKPIKESDVAAPKIFRGVAKQTATLLCQHYAQYFGLPAIVLRFFSIYGPWESPTRFIPTLLRYALSNETLPLTQFGVRHDFLFVEDAVDACLKAIEEETSPAEIFNIGSGAQWSNEEVVPLAEKITGRKLNLKIGGHPGNPPDTSHWVADITKAATVLGWRPKHTLDQGLLKTLEWMKSYYG